MMKMLKTILCSLFLLCAASGFAQTKEEAIRVSGECGMCKKKIENAAKTAGASFASWDVASKVLTVKYESASTNAARIQQEVAKAGYDTKDVKATEEAYNKLHECCKYERTAAPASGETDKASCCADGDKPCCADGKCTKGGACCKDGKCDQNAAVKGQNGAASCCKKA